ncbi:MAG: GNAT family N-acetyltransferase [Planctomycetota bacterium]
MSSRGTSTVVDTARLRLRKLSADDAAFIHELVNDPAWLCYIGDKHVHTHADARRYIEDGPAASYARNGFGLYCVELADAQVPIGICGLIRREALADVDLGFAFLERHRGRGYAREAAAAVLEHARRDLRFARVIAITLPHNRASIRVLESSGFAFERRLTLPGESAELCAYAREL